MEDFSAVSSIRRRVLVVEDELINREILGAILSNDYDVDYAVNGQEAWDLIKEKGGSYYSLLLLDLLCVLLALATAELESAAGLFVDADVKLGNLDVVYEFQVHIDGRLKVFQGGVVKDVVVALHTDSGDRGAL